MARRIASVIKSGFIRASVHHFTSATLRRFHRRRLLHATDFSQAAGFTVRGGVSVFPKIAQRKLRADWKKCLCKLVVKEENREKATLVAGKKPNEKSQIV
jgi:hypothetical protein